MYKRKSSGPSTEPCGAPQTMLEESEVWGSMLVTCHFLFQNKNTPLQDIKTRSSKSQKIEIFPKGLVHGFRQKLAIFPSFYFRQYDQKKSFKIFENEKQEVQKAEQLRFFRISYSVLLVKNWPFFHFLILPHIG